METNKSSLLLEERIARAFACKYIVTSLPIGNCKCWGYGRKDLSLKGYDPYFEIRIHLTNYASAINYVEPISTVWQLSSRYQITVNFWNLKHNWVLNPDPWSLDDPNHLNQIAIFSDLSIRIKHKDRYPSEYLWVLRAYTYLGWWPEARALLCKLVEKEIIAPKHIDFLSHMIRRPLEKLLDPNFVVPAGWYMTAPLGNNYGDLT